jgi:hypothetical protein
MNTNTKSHLLGILLLLVYIAAIMTWAGSPVLDLVMYGIAGWSIGGSIADFSRWVFKQ